MNWKFKWWDWPLAEFRCLIYFLATGFLVYAYYKIYMTMTPCGWKCAPANLNVLTVFYYFCLLVIVSGFWRRYRRERKELGLLFLIEKNDFIATNLTKDKLHFLNQENLGKIQQKMENEYGGIIFKKYLQTLDVEPFEVNDKEAAISRIKEGYVPFLKREVRFFKLGVGEQNMDNPNFTDLEKRRGATDIFIEVKLYIPRPYRVASNKIFYEKQQSYFDRIH